MTRAPSSRIAERDAKESLTARSVCPYFTFLLASGSDFWLVGSPDSTPFPECPLPSEESVFQLEISQVRNLLCKIQTLPVSPASAGILKSFDEGRRLRLRCWGRAPATTSGGAF
jgi:hypothetical protein